MKYKLWDCFTFFNELSLLKIRCEELKTLKPNHVLIEGTCTFTGNKKQLHYLLNRDKFSEYNINHFVTDAMPNDGNAWNNERHSRNYILNALEILGANDEDLVIISDIDEIPKSESIIKYIPNDELTALRIDTYRYYLNCLEANQNWIMPRICKYKYLKDKTPDQIRNSGYEHIVDNAGWHFSYIGNEDDLKYKIESFSHTELNTEHFKDKLRHKLQNCQSLFGDDYWKVVDIDNCLPKYVCENINEFENIIYKK